MTARNPNLAAADAFVAALVAGGVRHVCITPGSRSTPLTVAFATHPGVKAWLHLDERASSFFALGLARATGMPVALVCTSGTAASNYHPAVVEASHSRIPLIVCTADRPQRLRDIGADQTMDQVRMFGSHARWAQDLALPVGLATEASYFAAAADRAIRTALAPLPGPVQLNFPFDEPLLDSAEVRQERPRPTATTRPEPRSIVVPPNDADVVAAAEALSGSSRPLIIAGPETGGLPADAIAALAARLDAPILADPLSGLRMGAHDGSRILDSYDAMVRDPRSQALQPDAVVRFGGVPTSKALNQFLANFPGSPHILCDRWGSWRDPSQLATHVVQGDSALIAERLTAFVEPASNGGWARNWGDRNARARGAMQAASSGFDEPFEGRVFTALQAALPEGATIFVGNSMPVRDADSFLVSGDKRLTVIGNRGVNGIDGVNSSALGTAAAGHRPVVLVIGDISFYHDLTGLWAAKHHGLDLTVVLVNNNGGGIFHYLPQAAHDDVFEEWFGTAPNLDFAPAVQMFGGRHVIAEDWRTFEDAVAAPARGLTVVELRTDRARNTAMHRNAWAAAAEAAWAPAAIAR